MWPHVTTGDITVSSYSDLPVLQSQLPNSYHISSFLLYKSLNSGNV